MRALAAVHGAEVRGLPFVIEGRAELTRLVACRRLELDDVGAVVREHLRAKRSGEHARQVDDPRPVNAPRVRSRPCIAECTGSRQERLGNSTTALPRTDSSSS